MLLLAMLLSLIVWGLIFYVLWWGLAQIGLPEPFAKIATVILVVATIVIVVGILTSSIPLFPFVYPAIR